MLSFNIFIFLLLVIAIATLIMSQLLSSQLYGGVLPPSSKTIGFSILSSIVATSPGWMKALQSQVLDNYTSCMPWTQGFLLLGGITDEPSGIPPHVPHLGPEAVVLLDCLKLDHPHVPPHV
jgi:hypothetical protein